MQSVITRRKDQSGRVLILVLVIIGLLSMFWAVALNTTGLELLSVGGRKSATQQLFDAEAGVASVVDNLNALLPSGEMAINAVIGPIEVKDPASDPNPANQRVVARVTIRPVQSEDAALANANKLPAQEHKIKGGCNPEKPSGMNVIGELYGVNAVTADREIQVGICREVLSSP